MEYVIFVAVVIAVGYFFVIRNPKNPPKGCTCDQSFFSQKLDHDCPAHKHWQEPLYPPVGGKTVKANFPPQREFVDHRYFSDRLVHVWIDDTGDSGWAGWKILCIECYEKALDNVVIEECNRCTPRYLSKFKDIEEPYCADCGGQG